MADDGVIFENADHDGPGTHVIVFGMSEYRHLLGGAKERVEIADGRGQLQSPARSALALAQWLLDNFTNSEKPLASLALVLSDDTILRDAPPPNKIDPREAARGDTASVMKAIGAWLHRASNDTGNLTIFYFCGHGSAAGDDVLLWLRDFGAAADRFDDALNLRRLLNGMQTQIPGEQLYLIDCCRAETTVCAEPGSGRAGVSSIDLALRGGAIALQNVQQATSDLSMAFGRLGQMSVFTDALIRALSGGGAQADLKYWVGTGGLDNALAAYIARAAERLKIEQVPERQKGHRFKLHKPRDILVPVHIGCTPVDAWEFLKKLEARVGRKITATREHFGASRAPDTWSFDAPHREHKVTASFQSGAPFHDAKDILRLGLPETAYDFEFKRRNGR